MRFRARIELGGKTGDGHSAKTDVAIIRYDIVWVT
jgi:hypothetical protein